MCGFVSECVFFSLVLVNINGESSSIVWAVVVGSATARGVDNAGPRKIQTIIDIPNN